jgi:hypothetical protein
MKLDFLDFLFENKIDSANPRIPHPEDIIFIGSSTAAQAVVDIETIIKNPQYITIKWDGGIALYFGRDESGQFFISDKYMYPKGILAHSPEEWAEYDRTKINGSRREDLPTKLRAIWSGIEAAVGNTQGVFMGDLMHTGELPVEDGNYVFEPTTVKYHVPVKSPLGTLIGGKAGIVVVHKFNDRPWDGKTGLTNSGDVAIVSPTAGNQFRLNEPTRLLNAAKSSIEKYGQLADSFRTGLSTKVAVSTIQTYFNKRITGQTDMDIDSYLQAYPAQHKKLVGDNQGGYLHRNKKGYQALEKIWNDIYNLKLDLVNQLNAQIKGFTQTVAGKPGGEGFVFPSSNGLLKLVNRGLDGFGGTHFARN